MKRLLPVLLAALLAHPAAARELSVPARTPSVLASVPDDWIVERTEYGWAALPPARDLLFAIGSASGRSIDAMLRRNDDWMRANHIRSVPPQSATTTLNGLAGTAFRFDTTDGDGPTRLDLTLLPGGADRVVMLTLWGSEAQRATHKAELDAILGSIRSAG